jgi:predicted transposase YdaD
MQTFIDRYLAEGEQRGRQQGVQQGEARLLIRQAKQKFGTVSQQDCRRITSADTDTLLRWSEKILDAKTLKEIFGA